MIDIYEFIENCKEEGLDSSEAANEYSKAIEEEKQRFLDDYYNDPLVNYGWHQQDIIDMYRRER